MTVDWTKPIQTRNGRPARLLGVLDSSGINHIVAVRIGEFELMREHLCDGKAASGLGAHNDIINVPPEPKRFVRWVNLYANGEAGYPFATRAEADCQAYNRIGCRRIELVEGFDDETLP